MKKIRTQRSTRLSQRDVANASYFQLSRPLDLPPEPHPSETPPAAPQIDVGDSLLTRQQTAQMLKMAPQTLASWASSGRGGLPFIKFGRLVRYKKSDVQRYIETHRIGHGEG
ncbi:MAG: helix-turn-helix domain-containing protein [Betaproteobacteria bacterium]|nr:helix-turn-helix domain-containing protein [Betaproteobacteria bacterium]MDE2122609.1 helix-turn-helix domain-containing protein [Betaproteobacteria bacterium]MDE2186557.1 helix-turn-helix domain-containing protein [Betaproteobacteria bacterium]MDE2324069.1 helix-turn-helix domain-containing protein [Betaproteobacteria bacterium]